MNDLVVENTSKTPSVSFNAQSGELLIKGVSVPENSSRIYKPLMKWIEEYVEKPAQKTTCTFNYEYINTSSLQFIFSIIETLKQLDNIEFVWYYFKDDEDIFEIGEDFEESSEIKFRFVAY
ncbi:DUF1987 domain-containing protein [bacterium]|nr:DUF1987 domain-containing protein [bacterium]